MGETAVRCGTCRWWGGNPAFDPPSDNGICFRHPTFESKNAQCGGCGEWRHHPGRYLLGTRFTDDVEGKARRVWSFISAGLVVSLTGIAVLLAYWLPASNSDWLGLATLVGAASFNGIASASLTLLLQFFVAQVMGVTTALQLLEEQ